MPNLRVFGSSPNVYESLPLLCISSCLDYNHTPKSPCSCSFMSSYLVTVSAQTEYGLRVSLRMILAHSSPCSQMFRFSCHWTTQPCTRLSLLTWGCQCAAWRFSTNLYNNTPLGSPQQLFDPNHHYFLFPTVPCLSTSCGTSCVWQVGVQTVVSLSLLRPHHPSITPLPPGLWEGSVSLLFFSLSFFNKCLHLHVFFMFVLFCPLFLLDYWYLKPIVVLFITLLCYLSITNATLVYCSKKTQM